MQYDAADAKRKALLEEVLTLKGSIRVFARVRPLLPHEEAAAAAAAAGSKKSSKGASAAAAAPADDVPLFNFPNASDDASEIELVEKPGAGVGGYGVGEAKRHAFDFHRVFPPLADQAAVFAEVEGLVQSALDGHRVCLFAYGQTGSGKTHTMQGDAANPGIIPRALDCIFGRAAAMEEQGWAVRLSVEFLEIYNEDIRDLLASYGGGSSSASSGAGGDSDAKHDIRHDKAGNTTVSNVACVPVATAEQVHAILAAAAAARSTGATNSNAVSSRSHAVFTLRIAAEHAATSQARSGLVNLIDLAGSERIAKSGVNDASAGGSDKLLKETQSINKSLSALSQVVCALATKQAHVPFRNSKLTYLLQHSLGGDCKTLMICNLNPLAANSQESLCTLRFAHHVAEVTTK
jgi:kinesin family protein C1